jgi:hypothetical protein
VKLWKDPVVEDVRAESRKLEAEAKGDLHTYFELLRRSQNRYAERVVAQLDAPTEETGAEAPLEHR